MIPNHKNHIKYAEKKKQFNSIKPKTKALNLKTKQNKTKAKRKM